jgi:altronate dehydratase small subunit
MVKYAYLERWMAKRWEAIVINSKDNVATTLRMLRAGATITMEVGGAIREIQVLADIPMGHKFALGEIGEGEPVVKYGETIGRSTSKIRAGEHVHVHNVVSHPRGDLS